MDTVFVNDQKYRYEAHLKTEKEKRARRKQFQENAQTVQELDQKNLEIVKSIIEKHGWLGPRQIGIKASQALFSVIQHADLETQETYYPLIEQAFKDRKLIPSNFAMLVDRIQKRKFLPQVYGTQILITNGQAEVYPLKDPDSVDYWRKSIGMDSIKFYTAIWNLEWDLENYKKTLPDLKAKYKVKEDLPK